MRAAMGEAMMIRKGNLWMPWSEEDREASLVFPENKPVLHKLYGQQKERSLRELRCYFGSATYVSELAINENMDSKKKVDHLTRLKCNFVDGTVFDDRGLLHWMVSRLDYANCHQPKAHKFIAQALEEHAALAQVWDVDEYVAMLNTL